MTELHPYTYVVLRYRPDPLAEEFANVGVVLHESESRFLGIRVRQNVGGRLTAMFPGLGREAIRNALKTVERGVEAVARGEVEGLFGGLGDAARLAARVLPADDSSFVWGPVGSGVTRDVNQTLDRLFARFVTRLDKRVDAKRDDAAVWRPVRDLLVKRRLADFFRSVTIESPLDAVEFEHAWKNGAWHCYQPVSFDLGSGDSIREKANKWAGQMLALQGASPPFRPHFVVGAPNDPRLQDDYRKAVSILGLAPQQPEIIEEAEIPALVDGIEDAIMTHRVAG